VRRKHYVNPGQRFGRGVITETDLRLHGKLAARLKCDCGGTYEAALQHLHDGLVQSCGCLRRQRRAETITAWNRSRRGPLNHRYTSGLSRHPLYNTWQRMMSRCQNPQDPNYAYYGGRGIGVCDAWRDEAVFITWIEQNLGPRPEGMTLDRIDNDGDYEPGNVQWATWTAQRRNQRPVVTGARALLAENERLQAENRELRERLHDLAGDRA
jgi:hypothetical protein